MLSLLFLHPIGYKFWRFDIRVVLSEQPGVLNYLVGLVGGQAPISSHSICLPARCACSSCSCAVVDEERVFGMNAWVLPWL
jgi:hypothetical protein